ncbi:flavin-containing monooxygenase 5-like [Parasteatoda tepidariorum]|uniref:flavin-containing monooxygenase 5-like n=1 Tax=Parasteatoda tepidariorum TaxID=114398 RepID=UPI00077FCD33|nr:flavin-containing monooxygenase 5-like [Parasteatoda tepidariorum]
MATKKRILIIGGGFAGITAIKSLKEEGLEPVCYEASDAIGGTWRYRDEASLGSPSIMPTTTINQSKEMGAVSDWMPDKALPNYMKHSQLLTVFLQYAEHFDCCRHVTCRRKVLKVVRSNDYDETGKWCAVVQNMETSQIVTDTFDGVIVAVGQFGYPKMAHYPGLDEFKGIKMHTHELKHVDIFKGKNVLIIGAGCSGLDAAVDISNVSKQVYLSTRSGVWIIPRVGPYGLPLDFCYLRRIWWSLFTLLGHNVGSRFLEEKELNRKFNHNLYNIRPTYRVLSKDPSVNDIIPSRILTKSVIVQRDVKYFTDSGVAFEDDSKVYDIDAVIMATGYHLEFPFLEDDIFVNKNGRIELYKCVYPPKLKHPTLAIVALVLPFGPGFPLGEMQLRWISRVFSEKCKLPTKEIMMQSIEKRHEENVKRYVQSDKMSIRVDYIDYLDELAVEIGVKPNFWNLLFTDPKLFKALIFGPSVPYQYRLIGPHKWDGARNAILTTYDRVRYPLSSGKRKPLKKTHSANKLIKYLVAILLFLVFFNSGGYLLRYCILLLIALYIKSMHSFGWKYFLHVLLLPFYVPWNGFVPSFFVILFVPFILATIPKS